MEMFVFSEGRSEIIYMQKLRSFINREGLIRDFKFEFDDSHCIKGVGAGNYTAQSIANKVLKCILEDLPKKSERKDKKIAVWIDYDIFQKFRKTLRLSDFESIVRARIAESEFIFYYNEMNFEDFFVLHFNDKVDEWNEICNRLNHFNEPKLGEDNIHLEYFKTKVFPGYRKDLLIRGFELDVEKIINAINNSRSTTVGMSSDIVDLLEDIIKKLD